MSKPYPTEFRDDVVYVARNCEPGVMIEKIAEDFGVHPMRLQKWLRRPISTKVRSPVSPGRGGENCELRKRVRLLEQENEVRRRICPRRTCREKVLPARE